MQDRTGKILEALSLIFIFIFSILFGLIFTKHRHKMDKKSLSQTIKDLMEEAEATITMPLECYDDDLSKVTSYDQTIIDNKIQERANIDNVLVKAQKPIIPTDIQKNVEVDIIEPIVTKDLDIKLINEKFSKKSNKRPPKDYQKGAISPSYMGNNPIPHYNQSKYSQKSTSENITHKY